MLSKFPNLKIISRDRGNQYRNIQDNYTRIADRFHLLMNLSDTIISEIKRVIPREIKLSSRDCLITHYEENCEVNILALTSNISAEKLSHKQKEKLELVLEIKEKVIQGISQRQLAKEYSLSRTTVKKYTNMVNPLDGVKYDNSNKKHSKFDKHKEEILNLCNQFDTVSNIKLSLEESIGEKISYSSLNHYIRKHQLKSKYLYASNNTNIAEDNHKYIKILRSKLIKYILDWKLKMMILII